MEGRPPTEQDLVARAQRGDVDAYERIVQAYQGISFRVAYLLCGDASEAEEAAQEGLVKALRALPRFRPGAAAAALAPPDRGQRGPQPASLGGPPRQPRAASRSRDPPGGRGPVPEAAVLGAEQRAELLAAVNTLREEERLVVACRYFLELSEAETAAALDLRPGTVKSRLSRALDHLRAALEAAHA